MAMRSVVSSTTLRRFMDRSAASGTGLRYFSDGSGRVLGDEERAAENVYIKKMEKERLEKQKAKAEKEKAEKEKTDKLLVCFYGEMVKLNTPEGAAFEKLQAEGETKGS